MVGRTRNRFLVCQLEVALDGTDLLQVLHAFLLLISSGAGGALTLGPRVGCFGRGELLFGEMLFLRLRAHVVYLVNNLSDLSCG